MFEQESSGGRDMTRGAILGDGDEDNFSLKRNDKILHPKKED